MPIWLERFVDGSNVAYVVDVVPHPSGGETGCVPEVFDALGESITVVAVPLSAVEPLAADEVFAVRRLSGWETPAPRKRRDRAPVLHMLRMWPTAGRPRARSTALQVRQPPDE